MEEFTPIAIWILMTYLITSIATGWFMEQPSFSNNGLIPNTDYNEDFINTQKQGFQSNTCGSVESNILAYGLCFLGQITSLFFTITESVWNIVAGWTVLLDFIFDPIPGGELFKNIIIPFFGLIEFMAILVLSLRVGGIIRGGS